MEPFEEHQSERDLAEARRQRTRLVLIIVGILAVVALAVVLHLAGATPTHSQ